MKKLKRLGFTGPYPGSRHLFMKKGDFRISVPNPHRGDISEGLVAEILREIEIKVEDWEKL